jgi:hypothetical protein
VFVSARDFSAASLIFWISSFNFFASSAAFFRAFPAHPTPPFSHPPAHPAKESIAPIPSRLIALTLHQKFFTVPWILETAALVFVSMSVVNFHHVSTMSFPVWFHVSLIVSAAIFQRSVANVTDLIAVPPAAVMSMFSPPMTPLMRFSIGESAAHTTPMMKPTSDVPTNEIPSNKKENAAFIVTIPF